MFNPPIIKPTGDSRLDMVSLQRGLKNNSEDISAYVSDLNSWQKEVTGKDKDSKLRSKKGVSSRLF